jgi:hypothetical protein
MGVTLVTYVTFVSKGGVKKCFLSLRQTALLSAEGKNEHNSINLASTRPLYVFT